MACFRISCDVEMAGDWRVTNDTTILLGNADGGEVECTLVFANRQLLRLFAHDINKMVGLKDDLNTALFPVEENATPPSPNDSTSSTSPPAEAEATARVADLDISSDELDTMTIETPLKQGISKKSPFSEESANTMISPSEIMDSQAVWTRY
jgi:hypothetical protein